MKEGLFCMRDFNSDNEEGAWGAKNSLEDILLHVDATASKEEIIRQMETCPICGGKLRFSYFADFPNLCTNEIARCNECHYRSKRGLKALV